MDNCSKLLVQFKAALKQVQGEEFPTLKAFMTKYVGIMEDRPITMKDDKGNTSKLFVEIVALFVFAMDIRSMEDLYADLKKIWETTLAG